MDGRRGHLSSCTARQLWHQLIQMIPTLGFVGGRSAPRMVKTPRSRSSTGRGRSGKGPRKIPPDRPRNPPGWWKPPTPEPPAPQLRMGTASLLAVGALTLLQALWGALNSRQKPKPPETGGEWANPYSSPVQVRIRLNKFYMGPGDTQFNMIYETVDSFYVQPGETYTIPKDRMSSTYQKADPPWDEKPKSAFVVVIYDTEGEPRNYGLFAQGAGAPLWTETGTYSDPQPAQHDRLVLTHKIIDPNSGSEENGDPILIPFDFGPVKLSESKPAEMPQPQPNKPAQAPASNTAPDDAEPTNSDGTSGEPAPAPGDSSTGAPAPVAVPTLVGAAAGAGGALLSSGVRRMLRSGGQPLDNAGQVPPPQASKATTTSTTAHVINGKPVEGGSASTNPAQMAQELQRIERKLERMMGRPAADGGGEWFDDLADSLSLIKALWDALTLDQPEGSWRIEAPCDKTPEGAPVEVSYQFPAADYLAAIMARLEALGEMQSDTIGWRRRTCRGQTPTNNVTITAYEIMPE